MNQSLPLRSFLAALALVLSPPAALAQTGLVVDGPLTTLRVDLEPAPLVGSVPTGSFVVGTDAAYHSIDVAVDAQGGYHAAFMTWAFAEHSTVYYGYCAPGNGDACADGTGWSLAPVSDDMPFVQLRLTPQGQPRLLLSNDQIYNEGPVGRTLYRYAECNASCTSQAGWSVAELGYANYGGEFDTSDYNAQTFALDAEGRPRFLYFDGYTTRPDGEFGPAMYLALCDAQCADGANWRIVLLPGTYRDHHSQLAIGPDGRPRVVAVSDDAESFTWLVYGECTATCADTADWSAPAFLLRLPSGPGVRDWSLTLDAQGRPRILAQPLASPLTYLWCDSDPGSGSDCASPQGWDGYVLTFTDADEYAALAIDPAGRPRIAFKAEAGLAYASCEDGCETDQPTWSAALVDGSEEIAADLNIPILPGCIDGAWIGGYRPQIALDAAGNPMLGHDAEFLMRCYNDPQNPNPGDTYVETKWWTSRVVLLQQPGEPTPVEPTDPGAALAMTRNYPNPFGSSTTIGFTLRETGPVTLSVFDALGREVARPIHGVREAGSHEVVWDASGLPSGLYVYRLTAGNQHLSQRMTLVN